MSISNARPDSKRRLSKLRNIVVLAVLVSYPVVAWWAFSYGGNVGQAALWVAAWPQVFCYVVLLWLFGRTLFGRRQALITQLARFVHGELSADIERYTRQVTVFWCCFFVAMIFISLFLFIFVSTQAWLLFANIFNLPLLAAAFVGEYGYRIKRFPEHTHVSLTTTIRAFRDNFAPDSRK